MSASLKIELGPCDDDAKLFIDGHVAMDAGLGESRTAVRAFQDGDHSVGLYVMNSGGWAWQARLRLVANGNEAVVDKSGGTGFWTGQVYGTTWQFTVKDGTFSEFIAAGGNG